MLAGIVHSKATPSHIFKNPFHIVLSLQELLPQTAPMAAHYIMIYALISIMKPSIFEKVSLCIEVPRISCNICNNMTFLDDEFLHSYIFF